MPPNHPRNMRVPRGRFKAYTASPELLLRRPLGNSSLFAAQIGHRRGPAAPPRSQSRRIARPVPPPAPATAERRRREHKWRCPSTCDGAPRPQRSKHGQQRATSASSAYSSACASGSAGASRRSFSGSPLPDTAALRCRQSARQHQRASRQRDAAGDLTAVMILPNTLLNWLMASRTRMALTAGNDLPKSRTSVTSVSSGVAFASADGCQQLVRRPASVLAKTP